MNKKVLVLLPTITLLITPFLCNVNSYQEVEAYDINSLPTTINLNDASDQVIRNYYSNLNSLGENELKGTNLLKNLKPILKNNQKYYSYDSGSKIWQAYEITDRDWKLSPASEIDGYNPTTNTITGYSYGSSASKPGSNPYIHALYTNRDVDNHVHAWKVESGSGSSHGNNGVWCIDREHIWPKSAGFENEAKGGARGDLMHLWAGDSYVNSALHSNLYYGYVDKTKAYTDGKDKYTWDEGNLRGKSKTLGGTVDVFEPQDSDKGDIARAVFYMVARYNYLSGSDVDAIDSDNPNLELVNDITSWKLSGYQSTTTVTGQLGIISDLLEWNKLDPVDEYEIHRNNLLFNNYTNNRNPFIDFPQWADYIWGSETGHVDPKNDDINGSGTSVSINISESSHSLVKNNSFELTASSSVQNVEFAWSVNDDTVLSLSSTNGSTVTVNALKAGKATVTVSITVNDVQYFETCEVTVTEEKALVGITIKSKPTKLEYNIGDEFEIAGLIVAANYNDDSEVELDNNDYVLSGFDSSKGGNIIITIIYSGFTTTFEVTIIKSLTGIEIKSNPNKIEYLVGDTFDKTGLVVVANYNDNSHEEIVDYNINGFDSTKAGKNTVIISYKGFTASFEVTISEPITIISFLKNLPLPALIGIGAGVLLIVVAIIIILVKSKKARKMVVKATKNQVKKSTKKKTNNKK